MESDGMDTQPIRRVLVTGTNGNLGRKLVRALLAANRYDAVLAVDLSPPPTDMETHPALIPIVADLARRDDERWIDAVRSADAIVHFAAQNPHLVATWEDAAASFDMTANLLAEASHIGRFVFASSNHVMGGYKETAIAASNGALTTRLPPLVGTRFTLNGVDRASTAYATAKLMGERLLAATASRTGYSSVALRIGWCQPGDNRPEAISASGTPIGGAGAQDAAAAVALRWFRSMWLSNTDFCGFFQAALMADAAAWPAPAIVLNAMSANRGMPWEIDPARQLLGFMPGDDIWDALPEAAPAGP
jgi:nucleoside-diphosphate-sugar epimerase